MSTGPIETAKFSLARSLVELAWDESIPQTFDIKYKGADWEVVVRIKSTEDGDCPGSPVKDFPQELPE
ncbi:MAG TPA: hypothetical protein VK638_40315 [Edaphobacter sp.]|jgi:hypothetical protein|nr:hypothetical protein [Edaphobacter sp.]